MTPKIKKILALFNEADAITLNDGQLLDGFASYEPNGTPDNEILRFSWIDDEAGPRTAIFTEEGLEQAYWDGNYLIAPDNEGDETKILLLKTSVLKGEI